MRSPHTATKSSPRSPQLEKARTQPNAARKKERRKKERKERKKAKEKLTLVLLPTFFYILNGQFSRCPGLLLVIFKELLKKICMQTYLFKILGCMCSEHRYITSIPTQTYTL